MGEPLDSATTTPTRITVLAAEQSARIEAESALRRLQALQAVTDIALAHLSTGDLLRELLARVTQVLDVDNVAILIPADDGPHLVLHTVQGPEEQVADQVRVPIGQGVAGTIAATRRPLIVEDLRSVPVANPFLAQALRSLMGVPLVVHDRLVGVLHAATVEPRYFTDDDLGLLQLVGDRIGLALDHARLYEEEQRLRAAAEERAAKLEAVFEAIADPVLIFGPSGEVREGNTIARILLDLDASPLVSAQPAPDPSRQATPPAADGPPPSSRPWPLARVIGGEVRIGDHTADQVIRGPDGVEREFSISGAPIRDPRGSIIGAVCVLHDVTERRRLDARILAQRNRLQRVLDVLPEGILIADADPPTVVAMNTAAEELLGVRLVGQPVPIPPPGEHGEFAARRLDETPYPLEELPMERALLNGQVVRGEQFLIRNASSGREIAILASSAPLHDADGAVDGAVEVFQDISGLKELERQREEFWATVSHDLKNPLTSILGMSQLLQRRAQRLEAPESAQLADGLGTIALTARSMAAQINELLDSARLRMGRTLELERAPVDIVALLARLVSEYQQTTERHTLRLQAADEALISMVDPSRLQGAVANLLANAIKYSPRGGEILTSLERAEEDGGSWITISVADQGIGIPSADLPRVFERFYRAGNVAAKFAGTGLGLAGVRQIVEQHGGSVTMDSVEGAGTTVTIRLPWLPAPSDADP